MRYKSVEGIGCAWNADGLLVKNPVTRTTITTEPVTVALLHHFREWNTVAQAAEEVGYDEESVTEAVGALHSLGFLNSEDAPDGDESSPLGPWRPWSHEGTAFHFMTRDAPFVETTDQIREELTTELPPPLFKDYPDADRVFLPRHQTRLDAPYGEVLYGRRTHRDFSAEPVDRETFSTLMGAVFGLKDFIDARQFGSLMLRTSPSGGSRHELEAYVAVSDVADVSPGIYHYGVREHALELIREGDFRDELTLMCNSQSGVGQAAFSIILTSVVERMSSKYRHPRAYRVMLMNAGHLGQTFALTATALGLGPFQTAAFSDSGVEGLIGVDGVSETALYVLSAGIPRTDERGRTVFANPPMSLASSRATRFDTSRD
ncbi:SagB/ThcOx family dehydrogenase [Nocardiopsis terrae]